jgi:hypothetical protein
MKYLSTDLWPEPLDGERRSPGARHGV